jgi:hypothetical protein
MPNLKLYKLADLMYCRFSNASPHSAFSSRYSLYNLESERLGIWNLFTKSVYQIHIILIQTVLVTFLDKIFEEKKLLIPSFCLWITLFVSNICKSSIRPHSIYGYKISFSVHDHKDSIFLYMRVSVCNDHSVGSVCCLLGWRTMV